MRSSESLRDSGIGIVYVSHFLEELLEISDNLVILRNGKRVPEDIAPASDQLKAVVAAMLGETPEFDGGAGAAIHRYDKRGRHNPGNRSRPTAHPRAEGSYRA